MGCFYSVEGTMNVRDNEASREILSRLESECGSIEVFADEGEGVFTVEIEGGTQCAYDTVGKIDDILKEFGPHVTGAAKLWTECDGEEAYLFVGKEEDTEKMYRESLMDEAREALRQLTEQEAEDLLKEMQGGDFWRK